MTSWIRRVRGKYRVFLPATAIFCSAFLVACNESGESGQQGDDAQVTRLTAWAHSGQEAERNTLQRIVDRFNNEHSQIHIEISFLPDGSYNSQVQAAALANDLPALLEFDGPFVYNYVWQGHLISLDSFLNGAVRDNLIPSIIEQGTYRGKLYSLGMFDSGLGLFARKSMLEEAGIRIPGGPEDAWSAAEFEEALANLAKYDDDGAVLDLKLNYDGEWYTYAFSPALQSAGAGLIRRPGYQSADGVLNSPEAVNVMTQLQAWIDEDGYVDPNVDDNAFVGGRVALSWAGHWDYPRYAKAFPDDLLLLPLPDFGEGARTGQGSWNWGVTKRCEAPDAAMLFIEYLLQDEQVLAMSDANAAVPATHSAIEKSERYKEGSQLHLYVTQLTQGYAVPRPRTAAYPVITDVFQDAFQNVRNGADVQETLDKAVVEIDRDIEDNDGYDADG